MDHPQGVLHAFVLHNEVEGLGAVRVRAPALLIYVAFDLHKREEDCAWLVTGLVAHGLPTV